MSAPEVALVSFRLGGTDGVSVIARQWQLLLTELGCSVRTIAGAGPVDVLLPGLAIDAAEPPTLDEVAAAVASADLVIVENLCSLPLQPSATDVVARVLAGRRSVLHHHDLPWQRPRFEHLRDWPPTDPSWSHVTINERSRIELAERGITATTIWNAFDTDVTTPPRSVARERLGIPLDEVVALHPVRAIERKAVPDAIELCERLGATYWLAGDAEEDYAPTLDDVLGSARCPVRRGVGASIVDAYAAADLVVFPSTWEGFGNPTVESAIHRRPLVVRRYPVARELEARGFRWFDIDDDATVDAVGRILSAPDEQLADHNEAIATRDFSLHRLRGDLEHLLAAVGVVEGRVVEGRVVDGSVVEGSVVEGSVR